MLNSRQRAQLRGLANGFEPLVHIGKGGVTETLIAQAEEIIAVRELVKCRVLETAGLTSRQAADTVAEAIGADVVQVIGSCFILYRVAVEKEDRKIVLVK